MSALLFRVRRSSKLAGLFLIYFAFLSTEAWATSPAVTYHGRLFNADGVTPVTTQVQFRVQVRSPGTENCLLWEETQSQDLTNTGGVFVLALNDGSGTRTDTDGYTFQQILANNLALTLPSGYCTTGTTYTPGPTDGRALVVSFKTSTQTTWEDAPKQALNYAPKAVDAYQVSGFPATGLLRVAESDGTVDSVSAINNSQYNALIALINGTSNLYTQKSSAGAFLPVVSTDPTSPVAGQIWVNSVSGKLEYSDGTSVQTVDTYGGTVTSVATGAGLTGGPITTTGTISLAAVGSGGTGTKITYDTYGRVTGSTTLTQSDLPTISNAGAVVGSAITSGTIGGSTSISTTGNLQTTHDITAKRIFVQDNGANYVGLQAPSAVTATYSLVLPPSQGSTNSILLNDGSGNLSWVAQNTGSVTSVTGTSPIVISGTAAAPVVGIQAASTSQSGYLSSSDWTIFNNKLSTTLPSGALWVGNASGTAVAQIPSGDVSVSNTGGFSVNQIRGVPVSSAGPTAAGQILRYDGTTHYAPGFIGISDIRSTVAGNAQFFPTNCGAGQTLTYQSPTDTMVCTAISIGGSSFGSQTQNTFLAAPNGSSGTPSFRALASADLPTTGVSAGTYKSVTVDTTGRVSAGTNPTTLSGYGIVDAVKNGGQTGAVTVGSTDANALNLQTNGVNRVMIATGGNVGIGTTAPGAMLDVAGAIRLEGSSAGSASLQAATTTTPYTLTLPTALPGSAGYVLSSDLSGNLSWISTTTGNVTNVGLSMPSIFSVTNSPVTSTGTLTASLASQSAALVFAGPTTGAAATPTFRALASTDLPTTGTDGVYINGGNSFGTAAALGTNDSNTLSFKTNNATRMFLNASGSVGVGTTAPGSSLDVNGSIRGLGVNSASENTIIVWQGTPSASNAQAKLGSTSGVGYLSLQASNYTTGTSIPIYFYQFNTGSSLKNIASINATASNLAPGSEAGALTFSTMQAGTLTEAIRVNGSGYVGIGTTSPAAQFQVGADSTNARVYFNGPTSGANPLTTARPTVDNALLMLGRSGGTQDAGGLEFLSSPAGSGYGWKITAPDFNGPDLRIFRRNGSATWSEALRILNSSGYVGIGTTAPGAKLDVNGGLRLEGATSGYVGLQAAGTTTSYSLTLPSTVAASSGQVLTSDTSGNLSWSNVTATGYSGVLPVANGGTGSSSFTAGAVPYSNGTILTQDSSNFFWDGTNHRLGIGTTAPTDKLHVGGNIYLNDGKVKTNRSSLVSVTNGGLDLMIDGSVHAGVYTPASQSMAFYTNATERVRINSSGNVGIGTTAPLSLLDVNGGVAIGTYAGTAAAPSNGLILSGNLGIGTTAPSYKLDVAGTVRSSTGGFMFPDGTTQTTAAADAGTWTKSSSNVYYNSGNVGIGTTAPTSKLTLVGPDASSATTSLYVSNSSGTNLLSVNDGAVWNTISTAGGVSATLGFNLSSNHWLAWDNSYAYISGNGVSSGTSNYISFATNNTERARFDNNGNFGIGTTAPGTKLDVSGSIRADAGGTIIARSPSLTGVATLSAADTGVTSLTGYLATGGALALGTANTSGVNYERVRIDSSGNVGIGTTAPTSSLEVAGGSIVSDSVSNTVAYINFGSGNMQVTTTTATTINVCGLKDGGTYTLILTGVTAGSTVTVNGYTTYVSTSSCTGAITVDLGAGATTFVTSGNTNILTFLYTTKTTNGHTLYGSPSTNFNIQ